MSLRVMQVSIELKKQVHNKEETGDLKDQRLYIITRCETNELMIRGKKPADRLKYQEFEPDIESTEQPRMAKSQHATKLP
jgi:hypothetical protein